MMLRSIAVLVGLLASAASCYAASTTLSVVVQASGPVAPAQATAAGFTSLAFNSVFSTSTNVSSTGPWYNPGVWFQSAATGSLTPTNAGGALNLSWSPGDSVAGVTVGTMAPSGKANTSWQYGYIEVSAAFPPVGGEWPAIWMQSNTATTSYVPTAGAHSYSEVDIFEWQSQIPTSFNGHIHTWVAAAGTQVSDTQNNDSNSTATVPSGTNLANFNIYGDALDSNAGVLVLQQ